jgi:hypothetical protein
MMGLLGFVSDPWLCVDSDAHISVRTDRGDYRFVIEGTHGQQAHLTFSIASLRKFLDVANNEEQTLLTRLRTGDYGYRYWRPEPTTDPPIPPFDPSPPGIGHLLEQEEDQR